MFKPKVGSDKKYIIKNIPNFLSALANNEYVEYGKQLAFVHNQKVFSDKALKIIELMKFCMITYEQISTGILLRYIACDK